MRTCNAESQKKSAKESNFKEDDRTLPLYKLITLWMVYLCNTDVPNGHTPHGTVLVEEDLLGSKPGVHLHTQLFSLLNRIRKKINCLANFTEPVA